jgi:hypothetical protein
MLWCTCAVQMATNRVRRMIDAAWPVDGYVAVAAFMQYPSRKLLQASSMRSIKA